MRHHADTRTVAELFAKLGGDDPRDRLYALFDVFEAWFNLPSFRGCIFLTAAAEFPLPHDPAHRAAAAHAASFVDEERTRDKTA